MILTKKQFKGTYEEIADNFSQTRVSDWGEFELLKKVLFEGAKVLDLGCGNGRSIKFLLAHKTIPTGFDESANLIKIAKQKNPNISFVQGDMGEKLPFKSESFDAIWSIASFHHLLTKKDRKNALGEIHRTLKPEGKIVITTWNLFQKKFTTKRIEALARSILPNWHRHDLIIPFGKEKHPRFYHAFTAQSLKTLLEEMFFEVEEIFGTKGNQRVSLAEARNICVIAKKISRKKICQIPFDILSKQDSLNKLFELSVVENEEIPIIKPDKQNLFSAKIYSELKGITKIQKFITTPNPEMCIEANKNPKFLEVLNKADLSLADGSGIIWASSFRSNFLFNAFISLIKFLFSNKKIGNFERTQGSDVFKEFCSKSNVKIFLLGGAPGVSEKCAKYFKKVNPEFNLAGTDSGSAREHDDERICDKINQSEAEVLFVAFGAPAQELWIDRNLAKLRNINFAMGVGGSFDFIAGRQKRAPKLIQKIGLEWLWRLILNPKRIKRIWNATYEFVLLCVNENSKKNNKYTLDKTK